MHVGDHLETQCSLFTKQVADDPLVCLRLSAGMIMNTLSSKTIENAIQKYCFEFDYEQDEEGNSSLMWDIFESGIKKRFKARTEYNEQL